MMVQYGNYYFYSCLFDVSIRIDMSLWADTRIVHPVKFLNPAAKLLAG